MKATKYILIALFATGTTLTAFGEAETRERDGSRKEAHRAKMMERFDKDGDGELSGKERSHAKNAREKRESKGDKGEGKGEGKGKKNGEKKDCEKGEKKGDRGDREKGERGGRGQGGGRGSK